MTPEAAARQKIDDLLVAAGWAVRDYKALKPEHGVVATVANHGAARNSIARSPRE